MAETDYNFAAAYYCIEEDMNIANGYIKSQMYAFLWLYSFLNSHPSWSIIDESPAPAEWTTAVALRDYCIANNEWPWFVVEANVAWPYSPTAKQQVLFLCGTSSTVAPPQPQVSDITRTNVGWASFAVQYSPTGGWNDQTHTWADYKEVAKMLIADNGGWNNGDPYTGSEDHTDLYLIEPCHFLINADDYTIIFVLAQNQLAFSYSHVGTGPQGCYIGKFNSPFAYDPMPAVMMGAPMTPTTGDPTYDICFGRGWHNNNFNPNTQSFNYGYVPETTGDNALYTMTTEISCMFPGADSEQEAPGKIGHNRLQSLEHIYECPVEIWSKRFGYENSPAEYWGTLRFMRLVGRGELNTTLNLNNVGWNGPEHLGLSKQLVNGYKRINISGFTYYHGFG
jgi:hypothetical protein